MDRATFAVIEDALKSEVLPPAPGVVKWCSQISHVLIVHFIHGAFLLGHEECYSCSWLQQFFIRQFIVLSTGTKGRCRECLRKRWKRMKHSPLAGGCVLAVQVSPPALEKHSTAGTSPKGSICVGQIFYSDTEHRLGLSVILNSIGLSHHTSLNLMLK